MDDQKNELATVNAAEAALAAADFGEHAGKGFENQTTDDIAIPFVGLCQALSHELDEDHPKYIEGAVDGSLFNTVTRELFPETVYVVPCTTEHVYVEWIPRDDGGGFCGVHAIDSPLVTTAKDAAESFNDLKTDEGHELQETFYIYCLLLDSADATKSVSPIVMAFTSAKIKKYRSMMTTLRTIKGDPPMYCFRLAVSSVKDQSKKGDRFKNFQLAPAVGTSVMEAANLPGTPFESLLVEGKALVEAIHGGTAKADHASQGSEKPGGGDGDEIF